MSITTRYAGAGINITQLTALVRSIVATLVGGSSTTGEEVYVDLGSGTSFVIDWAAGGMFSCRPSGDFTVNCINLPKAGRAKKIVLQVVNGAGKTMTLPTGGTWGDIGTPSFSANKDLVSAVAANGESGTIWILSFPG